MSRVFGISGAQGGGKSTLLKELRAGGLSVDEFKVSRSVQAALGWTSLDQVMDSPDTMMQFQEEVFKQKYQNDLKLLDEKEPIILTERTFADICAYTSQWTWRFLDAQKITVGEAFNFLHQFTKKCARAQLEIYTGTILLPLMKHVHWENDPSRAKKSDADAVFRDICGFIGRELPISHRTLLISQETVPDRAAAVQHFLKGFV